MEGVALTVTLTADVEMGLTVRANPDAVPAAVRRFFDEAAVRSDVWGRFPDSALVALGVRTDASALLGLVGAFQTKESFEALKDNLNRGLGAALGGRVATEALPYIGPDWGLCVTAPPRDAKQWAPESVFAIRVAAGDKDAPVDRALVDALRSWAVLAATAHNLKKKDFLSLKTVKQNKKEVHYLASLRGQAAGLQPAFGLSGGYLILASSPEAFRRFAAATPATPSAGEVPLLRLSLKDVRPDRRAEVLRSPGGGPENGPRPGDTDPASPPFSSAAQVGTLAQRGECKAASGGGMSQSCVRASPSRWAVARRVSVSRPSGKALGLGGSFSSGSSSWLLIRLAHGRQSGT